MTKIRELWQKGVKLCDSIRCSRKAVQITIKRFQETGTYENRPKSGKKHIATSRNERLLKNYALRKRSK